MLSASRSSGGNQARRFDFSCHMRALCADMVARLPELGHVDLDRVALSFAQTRSATEYGLQATLTPMRFEGGALATVQRRRRYTVQRLFDLNGREMLYILTFYLPRFFNQTFSEKILTILHELWHIGPRFDGDLRRFEGRCSIHGRSLKTYDAQVALLARDWWAYRPQPERYAFLQLDFPRLRAQHGEVIATRIPEPKLIPCDD